MEQQVLPVVVSYHTPRWIKVALRSYRRHFPEGMILVVDNNPDPGGPGWSPDCERERGWLRSLPDVLLVKNDRPGKGHGTGIDRAVEWCRENDVALLLHFEPDCLISGRAWFDALRDAIDRGAWMAGSHRKLYGPIHPTPSLWRVDRIDASFEIAPRGDDERHPRFAGLVDLERLERALHAEGVSWDWWRVHWDTGQRAWFRAAVLDRAALVRETADFQHFWCGSAANRDYPGLVGDPRLVEFLEEAGDNAYPPRAFGIRPAARGRGSGRPRFCVVTPTIPGRERLLEAAIASVRAQDFPDLEHRVVGDGPCPESSAICASWGVRYAETPRRMGTWGGACRNLALEAADADYFVFLDDDNLLFRRGLARLHEAAAALGDPPLLAQKVLMLPRDGADPYILPDVLPPQLGRWDQLCACVRSDIARRVRFSYDACGDFAYISDCMKLAGSAPVLVDGVGGVHS